MMPPRSQQVEDGGLDFDIHPFWEEGSVERWKARATRSSAFPDGTWLRYYISANIICADEEVHRMVDVPFLGVGLVRFNEDKDEGSASRQEEANTMSAGKTLDLGEGITVPCLWATIEDMRPQNWHMAMKIHLDKRGGLGPLRVSRTDLERAAAGVQLRTKEGDPVWSQQALRSVELRVPPADPQDYVTVPDGVLDLNVKGQFEEGLRYSEPMALDDPRGPPSVLPQGSILRYYLCGEVSCRTEGMGKAFYVPLMGVGLVQYGPKAE
jgi:hypothetical protein